MFFVWARIFGRKAATLGLVGATESQYRSRHWKARYEGMRDTSQASNTPCPAIAGKRMLGPIPVPVLLLVGLAYLIVVLGDSLHWGGAVGLHWWADSGWTVAGLLATGACLRTAVRQRGNSRLV